MMSSLISEERGSVLLFMAAIVLPFLFFLFSLTLDVGMYLHEESEVQSVLDNGGLFLQRFLPYVPETTAALQDYVSQNPVLQNGQTTFSYDPTVQLSDVLTLRYERTFTPFFANLLGDDIGFQLVVESQVRVSPFDIELLIDSSAYLAPPITASQGWNSATEQPAWVFQQGLISYAQDLDNNGISEPVDPLVASQQCFSQPFLALKRSAARVYQYFSSFRDNAVGVSIYPSGTGAFLQTLRGVSPTTAPTAQSGLSFSSWNAPFVKNEHCAAAAEREPVNSSFQIPVAPASFEGLWQPDPSAGYMISQAAGWTVDLNYTNFSAESLIWSQAVRPNTPGDTAQVIQSVALGLFSAGSANSRGGLKNSASRQAIVFAGDVPWVSGVRFYDAGTGAVNPAVQIALQDAVTQIADAVSTNEHIDFRFFYLAFFHQGLSGTAAQFEAGMDAFRVLVDGVKAGYPPSVQKRLTLQVLSGDNPQALSDQVVSYLALNRRVGVISR